MGSPEIEYFTLSKHAGSDGNCPFVLEWENRRRIVLQAAFSSGLFCGSPDGSRAFFLTTA